MAPGLQDLAGSFKKLLASDGPVSSIKDAVASVAAANGTPLAAPHPLDALSPEEIERVGKALRKHFTEVNDACPFLYSLGCPADLLDYRSNLQSTDVKGLKINYICLAEPNKLDVLKYLGIPTKPEDIGRIEPDATVTIPRQAEAALVDIVTGTAYHIFTTITSEKVQIDGVEMLPKGVEPGITLEELIAAEEAVKADPRVQQYAAEVGVKPDEIFADGWSIGWDDRFPGRRLQQ